MVLTEAFAAGTPVVASDIAGYRDVVADGVDGAARPARRRDARWPRRCATSRSTRRASSALGAGAARERRALRLAAGRRSRSSTAYEDARAVPQPEGAARARRGARSACCPPTAWSRASRRAGCRRSSRAPAGGRGRARARRGAARRRGAGHRRRLLPGGPAHRARSGSATRSCARSPAWVLVGAGADVRLDAAARRLLARDPEGRAARGAAADGRRRAGHDDRRADVGDAARAARRALARAGRRAPARPRARARCRSCSARSSPRR